MLTIKSYTMIPSSDPNANKSAYDKRLEQFRNLTQRTDGNTNNLQHVTNYDFETNILPTLVQNFKKKKCQWKNTS